MIVDCTTFVPGVDRELWLCISHSVLLIFSLNHFHPPCTYLTPPPPNRAATCEAERNGNSGVARYSPTDSLCRPLALLVMHSWAILGGSYVNAWVCFWLGGTKSTLYKCTLKQLPLLPTAAPAQTSDCAAAWLPYPGWEKWMWTISNNMPRYETRERRLT